jgi:O-antigen/teichoic acid export membrane protein
VAVRVLDLPIKVGVGIAVFGATVGGIVAYIYLLIKMKRNKDSLNRVDTTSRETLKVSNKDIIIKILGYAAPFIFTSLITSFYNFVDLSTIIKTMVDGLKYSIDEAEVVVSILSTWGAKLNMIVAAIATGLVTSLIPNISISFVKNNLPDVRTKINRSLQILLYATVPMTLGISLLSAPIWTIFYGYDILSSNILRYYIFIALFSCVLTTLNVIFQFLNDNKRMLLYILTGLIIKTIFNIPFMYSFQEMGLHAGYGAITATILGFSVSIVLILRRLHKEIGINYEETITRLISILYACLVMTIVILLLQFIMPINMTNRVSALLVATIYSIIGIVVYLFVTIKQGLLAKIFGESFGNKILVKLKLKKD